MAYSKDDMLIKKAAQEKKKENAATTASTQKTVNLKKEKEETGNFYTNSPVTKALDAALPKGLDGTKKTAKEETLSAVKQSREKYEKTKERYYSQYKKLNPSEPFMGYFEKSKATLSQREKKKTAAEYKKFRAAHPQNEMTKTTSLDNISNLTGGKSWSEFTESTTREDLDKIDAGTLSETEKYLLEAAKKKADEKEKANKRAAEAAEAAENIGEAQKNYAEAAQSYETIFKNAVNERANTLREKGVENYKAGINFEDSDDVSVEVSALAAAYTSEELNSAKANLNKQIEKANKAASASGNKATALRMRLNESDDGETYNPAVEELKAQLKAAEAEEKEQKALKKSLTSSFDVINAAKESKWSDISESLKKSSDWKEKSAAADGEKALKDDKERALKGIFGEISSLSQKDDAAALGLSADAATLEVYPKMTESEKAVVRYLVRSGRSGEASDYADSIRLSINKRDAKEDETKQRAFADEHPVLASAGTIISAPVRGIEGLQAEVSDAQKAYIKKDYEPRDLNSDSSYWQRYSAATRDEVKKAWGRARSSSMTPP